jgi:hypothetical protein
LTKAIAASFGSVDGTAEDTPAERHDGLAAALNRIMSGGGAISMAQAKTLVHGERAAASEPDDSDPFAAIRAKAYSRPAVDDDDAPKPVAEIDPVAIYRRWNAARRNRDND